MNKIQRLRNKIQTRTVELNIGFESRPDGHWYGFGKPIWPGVTTKLQILKDQGLANWKMKRALEYVNERIVQNVQYSESDISQIIQGAKLAPQQEFEGAGDIGTAVHAWRELWMRNWIMAGKDISTPPIKDIRPAVKSAAWGFYNCLRAIKAEPLACELWLADEKLQLGGTLDDLWRVNNQNYLIDLKTSNIGNKNSYYLQVATYWKMFRRLYRIKIDKIFILHVSKTHHGEYKLIELKDIEKYYKMAEHTFKLYDDLQKLKELKKPDIIKI